MIILFILFLCLINKLIDKAPKYIIYSPHFLAGGYFVFVVLAGILKQVGV